LGVYVYGKILIDKFDCRQLSSLVVGTLYCGYQKTRNVNSVLKKTTAQILKKIWTDDVVEFKGQYYNIPASKIAYSKAVLNFVVIVVIGFLKYLFVILLAVAIIDVIY
jgi:hypothetical protein